MASVSEEVVVCYLFVCLFACCLLILLCRLGIAKRIIAFDSVEVIIRFSLICLFVCFVLVGLCPFCSFASLSILIDTDSEKFLLLPG